jgi:hypothetical protein
MQSSGSSDSVSNPLKFSGYIETYFGFDFGKPLTNNRPGFIYSHNRHNEVNLNLGFVKAAYQTSNVRGNLALMTGTYANANLSSEPGVAKNIFEANAGLRLSKTKNLWIDAGVFPSHIGFESTIGKDCWTLTRSILAENSPYYESGAKISYASSNEKWFLSGLLLNGWQHIYRLEGNSTLAFGHQIIWKPNSKLTLNSSSFIGSDKPDSNRLMRYFHNLYGIYQLSNSLGLILGFDMGAEQKTKVSQDLNYWYSPVAILQIKTSDKLKLAVRGEYYQDINEVIIAKISPNGFQTLGYSINLDYEILKNAVWRIELKRFQSRDKIFVSDKVLSNNNFLAITALLISF